jgi:hypothetical protein
MMPILRVAVASGLMFGAIALLPSAGAALVCGKEGADPGDCAKDRHGRRSGDGAQKPGRRPQAKI